MPNGGVRCEGRCGKPRKGYQFVCPACFVVVAGVDPSQAVPFATPCDNECPQYPGFYCKAPAGHSTLCEISVPGSVGYNTYRWVVVGALLCTSRYSDGKSIYACCLPDLHTGDCRDKANHYYWNSFGRTAAPVPPALQPGSIFGITPANYAAWSGKPPRATPPLSPSYYGLEVDDDPLPTPPAPKREKKCNTCGGGWCVDLDKYWGRDPRGVDCCQPCRKRLGIT